MMNENATDNTGLDWDKVGGMMPAVICDWKTNEVLMLGYMNKEAYAMTLRDKKATFFSRTRNKLWQNGETSGHFLIVHEIYTDCDNDTLLLKCEPIGPTCHTGSRTCFFKKILP